MEIGGGFSLVAETVTSIWAAAVPPRAFSFLQFAGRQSGVRVVPARSIATPSNAADEGQSAFRPHQDAMVVSLNLARLPGNMANGWRVKLGCVTPLGVGLANQDALLSQRSAGQEDCPPCLPRCDDLNLVLIGQVHPPPAGVARLPEWRYLIRVNGRNPLFSTAAPPVRPQPSAPEVYPFREADHPPFVPAAPPLRLGIAIAFRSAPLAPGINPRVRRPGFVPR